MKRIPNKKISPMPPKFNLMWLWAAMFLAFLGLQYIFGNDTTKKTTFTEFENKMLLAGDVEKLVAYKKNDLYEVEVFIQKDKLSQEKYDEVRPNESLTFFKGPVLGPQYKFTVPTAEILEQRLSEIQQERSENEPLVDLEYEDRSSPWTGWFVSFMLPLLILVAIWMFLMRRMSGGGGAGGGALFNIGKSKAQLFDKESQISITFDDVAGLEEAKEEVMEIVDFLKKPKKYTDLGGKIPKGALLVGPPGTGKTLLAKAVAGEAKVPFFSLSGSDFVEMFVGVGASRVRDLFKQAKEKAPCIIFIDEIDAIGRARGKNSIMGGNDERENTLNALLVEMDGFGTDVGVIILAATNRLDVLDSALLRPGRFDRQISIDKPDLLGREQIFKVHLGPLKLGEDVDAKKLSAQTPGFAGAEIANVCNEAALIAARRNKPAVDMQDFQDAIDRVIGGLEKKNKIISPEEKNIVAYHEAGHAIAGWFLEHADPLVKVSIVPRGVAALGYAQYLPREQFLYTTEQLLDGMCMTLGGRAAEDIIFGRISTGAQNDLERVTKLSYAMTTIYGMNHRIGNVSFRNDGGDAQFQRPYSERTAEMIDEEVRDLISDVYERAKQLLLEKKDGLIKIAEKLLEKEILFQSDLEEILGKRPFENKTTYDEFVHGVPQTDLDKDLPSIKEDRNSLENRQEEIKPKSDESSSKTE